MVITIIFVLWTLTQKHTLTLNNKIPLQKLLCQAIGYN